MNTTLKQYTSNIVGTSFLAISPFLIFTLLGQKKVPEENIASAVNNAILGTLKALVFLASPLLIAIGVVSIGLGIAGVVAQTIGLPFHFLYNALVTKREKISPQVTACPVPTETALPVANPVKDDIPVHHPALFTQFVPSAANQDEICVDIKLGDAYTPRPI